MKISSLGIVLAVAAVVGCSGTTTTIISSSSSSTTSSTSSPGAASDSATPASSSDVDTAKEQAAACLDKMGATGLHSLAGYDEIADCIDNFERLDGVLSEDQEDAFEHCLIAAAGKDMIWTDEGRTKFTNSSVPDCLDQVT